jgi:aminoglycoside 2'-N-acetyltransferase I
MGEAKAVRIEVRPGDDSWSEIQPLEGVVYPPEVLARIVWRDVAWANADSRVLVHEAGRLVSVVSLYQREGRHDGMPVRIGGIGGVMTHPDHRRRGFARAAMAAARRFFAADRMDFSLLFVEPKNIGFYGALGWRVFPEPVIVEQPAGRAPFALMTAMVSGLARAAPAAGIIDLCGLPW